MYYLRHKVTGTAYTNGGRISLDHPLPSDEFEWVQGSPPDGAELYKPVTKATALLSMFNTLPLTLRAAFYPIKGSVKEALEEEEFELAKEIINQQTVPPEHAAVKAQMLAAFDS